MPAFPAVSTVLDAFNRANEGPPMTGWADLIAGVKVVSNQAAGNIATANWSYLVLVVDGVPDFDLFYTIATKPAAGDAVALYSFDAAVNGYAVSFTTDAGADQWRLNRLDAGVVTQLGATMTQELAAGEKMGLRRLGNDHEAYYYNGSAWSLIGTRTDSTYAEKRRNLFAVVIVNTVARIDDLSGGKIPQTVELSGTASASITEADIVAGGKTIVLTVSGDRWIPSTIIG